MTSWKHGTLARDLNAEAAPVSIFGTGGMTKRILRTSRYAGNSSEKLAYHCDLELRQQPWHRGHGWWMVEPIYEEWM